MRVLAVPDESSSRTSMQMRVLAVHNESSSRTIDYYAVDHFYTSQFPFIVGFDPRLPSHTNSIKLYHLTTVVRQIDLLTAFVNHREAGVPRVVRRLRRRRRRRVADDGEPVDDSCHRSVVHRLRGD